MGNLKSAVVKQMQDKETKKQANLLKLAEEGPSIITPLNNRNFSMMDKDVMYSLIGQEITDIEFEPYSDLSFIEWTVNVQIKDDEIEIYPIIKNIKVVGKITGWDKNDKEVEFSNKELPVSIDMIDIDTFLIEDNKIKISIIDYYKGRLSVNFN